MHTILDTKIIMVSILILPDITKLESNNYCFITHNCSKKITSKTLSHVIQLNQFSWKNHASARNQHISQLSCLLADT